MSPANESYLARKAQISEGTLQVCVPIHWKAAGPPFCLRRERGLGDVEVGFFLYSIKEQVSTGIRGVAELCHITVWKPLWQPPQAISKSPASFWWSIVHLGLTFFLEGYLLARRRGMWGSLRRCELFSFIPVTGNNSFQVQQIYMHAFVRVDD